MAVEGGRATSVLLDFRRFRIPVAVEGGGAPSVLLDFRRFLNPMAVEDRMATSVLLDFQKFRIPIHGCGGRRNGIRAPVRGDGHRAEPAMYTGFTHNLGRLHGTYRDFQSNC